MDFPVRIATRGSPLALAQAHEVRDRLAAAHNLGQEAFEIVVIRTTGDRITDRPLSEAGGKGLFTKEIEEALADDRADLAVHSAKDVPTWLPDGMTLSAVLPREDPRDAFISHVASDLAGLPRGSVVGTASLRRQALVRRARPDLEVVTFRGNVQTRLEKLRRGEVQATLLAAAGLNRLGMPEVATSVFDPAGFLPALGQGIIAIETRAGGAMAAFVAAIDHADSAAALQCERAFLTVLDGSCRTPIAGHATVEGDRISFSGLVISPDGRTEFATSRSGAVGEAGALGQDAAEEIIAEAGEAFLAELRSH
ncbi:hydroxymethylbilane synthase [Lutibaculum baratangense]|uniref:hydroxymethylbilane synthase n=1 Tax=Lutibaculum baratangense TaxID=1358440 RepID=UPI00058B5754|nr:hydroxymethylbilane synthase [Lutibaculum baratangense]